MRADQRNSLFEKPTPAKAGEPVGADPAPHHLLDQNPHLLVHVEEAAAGPVLDRVGAEDGGVDLGHRVGERHQPLPLAAHVGEEEALVLAGEGRAEAVLEQRGAAHDDRAPLELVEHRGQPAQHLRREEGALEQLHQVRVLEPHPIGVVVLAVVNLPEVVVLQEVDQPVGGDVPAQGGADAAEQLAMVVGPLDDLGGEEEPGRLAADPAVAARRIDQPPAEAGEVVDAQVLLGGVDEVELVGEEAPHQRRPQSHLGGLGEVPLLDTPLAEALEVVDQVGERRVGALDRVLEHRRLLLADPALEAGEDLPLPQMPRGEAEGALGGGGVDHERAARLRPVLLLPFAGGDARRVAAQHLARLLDAAPAEVVDHLARQAAEQDTVGLAQELDHRPPLRDGGRGDTGRRIPVLLTRREGAGEPLGDGVEEPPLVVEERAVVGARPALRVVDLEPAGRLPVHEDRGGHLPARGLEARRFVDAVAQGGAGDADAGVLPAGGQLREHGADQLLRRRLRARQRGVHPVEAAQLLARSWRSCSSSSTGRSGPGALIGAPRLRGRPAACGRGAPGGTRRGESAGSGRSRPEVIPSRGRGRPGRRG
ncbi:MAG: hypothetical protein M5U13_14745 [Thermoanaerobaculia bacterium]|nr:hypothetical protein [Thermoanaerobaculia bacterium]